MDATGPGAWAGLECSCSREVPTISSRALPDCPGQGCQTGLVPLYGLSRLGQPGSPFRYVVVGLYHPQPFFPSLLLFFQT